MEKIAKNIQKMAKNIQIVWGEATNQMTKNIHFVCGGQNIKWPKTYISCWGVNISSGKKQTFRLGGSTYQMAKNIQFVLGTRLQSLHLEGQNIIFLLKYY